MKNPLKIFHIRREERWPALAALLYVATLNALVVGKYFDKFTQLSDNYHKLFVDNFAISGFDPLTYAIVSHWDTEYNVYRHPLLAFFMYIPNQINQGLMMFTGMNCAQLVVAVLLVACSFYAFVLLFRIFREVIELPRGDAALLAGLTFTFGYVMVSVCVPDHFALSMFMLVLTLYVAGRKMKSGQPLTVWQTVGLFVLTAGISLNNGIKVLLANLFVNGRRFWRPANLLLAVVLPSALLWGVARLEWQVFEYPKAHARQVARAEKAEQNRLRVYAQFKDTTSLTDSTAVAAAVNKILKRQAYEKYVSDHKKPWNQHAGKPMAKGEFSQWTDISTPRWGTLVENWFGESVQLHQDHLLEDTLRSRPVVVAYRSAVNYVVEALLVVLFAAGVWAGRRNRFLWLVMSFFAFDVFIHIVLGFGINEVYIMGAHWLFVMPLAIGFLMKRMGGMARLGLRVMVAAVALWLLAYNGCLFAEYLLGA